MNTAQLHQWLSILILAFLLFFPVSKIIWILSVRRLQRKLNTTLDDKALAGQLSRARFIAVFASLIFSYLFYINVIKNLYG